MSEWPRNDIIAFVGLIVALLTFVATLLALPNFRKLIFGFEEPALIILTPKNKEEITVRYGEKKPIVRPISGKVTGFNKGEIEKLGLYIEILIKTDTLYFQGNATVESDGRWVLRDAKLGGYRLIIRALLKDRYAHEHESTEIEVALV